MPFNKHKKDTTQHLSNNCKLETSVKLWWSGSGGVAVLLQLQKIKTSFDNHYVQQATDLIIIFQFDFLEKEIKFVNIT